MENEAEPLRGWIVSPANTPVEATVQHLADWLRLVVEMCGVGVILAGSAAAMWVLVTRRHRSFNHVRLMLARYLALALELQLGADILATAIAPTWDRIGKLAAIAVIRTGLNYFLTREMHEEEAREGHQKESGNQ